MSKIGIVIQREYCERVTKKSFIITTILMPLLMVALMVIPTIIMTMVGPSETTVLVIDKSNKIFQKLESNEDVKFIHTSEPLDSALAREDVGAVLVIPENIIEARGLALKYYSNGPSSMTTESLITRQINDAVEADRLKSYQIDDLAKILDDVHSDVALSTLRNDKDSEEATSSGLSYGIGIMMSLTLYMFLLIYGQMVMTSIIEEKNNRVLELVVSSIKPAQLMMGKILGVTLVALTQILIWGVLITCMSAFLLPALLPAEAMQDVAAVQAGNFAAVSNTENLEIIQAVSLLGSVGYVIKLFGLLTLFLMTGFLFYAAIYAAIGSAVDNIQDAGQLQTVIVVPVIFGFIFAMTAAADPSSSLAFWMSIIPFTAPMVMVARIPFGIPGWEIALSLVLLIASFVGMVWLAGKIYRVGIFMYGKKPTFKEIIRWVNYK
ncbi:MAG: ABC transporter permease [Duncaniella sp.]|nr:ABC transporter permease [Duncaniella sp.]HBI57650.1 ABC transporter permease [Porphyromonadaceae bacterium]